MDKHLIRDGYLIKKSNYDTKTCNKIINDLTITPVNDYVFTNKSYRIYKESENYFFLPLSLIYF